MKLPLLFVPSLALILFVSCKQEAKNDYAVFSGKIENPDGDKLSVKGNDFEQDIVVADDGTFSDTLKIDAGYYSFSHVEYSSFFLAPGYNLNLTINTEDFDRTVKYTGKGAEINNYMASKIRKNQELIPDFKEFQKLNETDFVALAEGLKTAYLGMLENLKEVDASFYKLEKRNILYDHFSSLTKYENNHRYYAGDPDFTASQSLLEPLSELDIDNSEDYRHFSRYRYLVEREFIDDYEFMINPDTILSTLKIIKELKSENIKNGLMNSFSEYLSPSNEQLSTLYDVIMDISTDEDDMEEITEYYNKVKNLVKGNPAPKFNYVNYTGGKTSMDDLKGKYVYFDIWATWCGPCIHEIPYLKEMEKKYRDSNVQFVSISIDKLKDFEKWKEFIVEKDLGGIQLYADGDSESSIIMDYAIEGIPRFILIDPDGIIVNADAPRPSDPKLAEMLDELVAGA